MLSWLAPTIVAVIALAWGVYQHYHPRVLCELTYAISDTYLDDFPLELVPTGVDGAGIKTHEIRGRIVGKVIRLHSTGNTAALGVLLHMRMRHPIAHFSVHTDEEWKSHVGEYDLQVKIPNLNPTDNARVIVYCRESDMKNETENILMDHRVSLSEGRAKRVNRIKDDE